MDPKLKSRLKFIEEEFLKFQRPLFQWFFSFLILLVCTIILMIILQVETLDKPLISVCIATSLIVLILIICWFNNFRFLELCVIILCLVIYSLYFQAKYETVTSQKDLVFGYMTAFFQRISIERLPLFRHKLSFAALAAIVRFSIMGFSDIDNSLIMVLFLMSEVLLDFNKAKKDFQLFRSFKDSSDGISTFKEIFSSHISESILIFKSNLSEGVFANEAFKKNFVLKKNFLKEFLQRFRLDKLCEQSPRLTTDMNKIKLEMGEDTERNSLRTKESTVTKESNFTKQPSPTSGITLLSQLEDLVDHFEKDVYSYSTADGHACIRKFEVKAFPLFWEGHRSFAIILNDVTDKHAVGDFQIADKSKDMLVAMISHELRTPLNGIYGMLLLIEKEIINPHLVKYLKACKTSAKLLLSLVNSILDMGQIKNNKLKLDPGHFKLKDIIDDVVSLFDFQCQEKGLYLKVSITKSLPRIIYTDKNRLTQIIINLLSNALKFTFTGGITLEVEDDEDYPSSIRFSVSDTGIGIQEEDINNLFKAYGKLERTADINPQGVGLGLSISNKLAILLNEEMEGSGIMIESEYRKGSTFKFLIKKRLTVVPSSEKQISKSKIIEIKGNESKQAVENQNAALASSRIFSFNKKDEDDYEISDEWSEDKGTYMDLSEKIHRYYTTSQPGFDSPIYGRHLTTAGRENSDTITFDHNSISPRLELLPIESAILKRKKLLPTLNKSPKILVIDDNMFNLMVAKELIEHEGVLVDTAVSGSMAIQQVIMKEIEKKPYKLILMDCEMPQMNGYDTTKELIKMMNQGDISRRPIVALTANNVELIMHECLKIGMVDCLAKPLSEEKVKLILKKYLRT